jgi:hypothetical protein
MESLPLLCFRLFVSIAALRADDFRILSIVNCDVVPQEISERHMVSAVELEFSAFEGFDNLLQIF